MKLQRTTWLLLGFAVILGGGVLIAELQKSDQPQSTVQSQGGSDLFAFEEADVQTLRVETGSQTLEFERENSEEWRMTAPQSGLANPSTIAYVLNLLATSQAQSPNAIAPDQKAEYGLEQPFATIQVELQSGETHTLLLGNPNFDESSRYAIADPPAISSDSSDQSAQPTVVLVPSQFVSAVDRPLEDWQQVEIPALSPREAEETGPRSSTPSSSPSLKNP